MTIGGPAFKLRSPIERHGIRVFCSNYALYGDMSRRVNRVLGRFAPEADRDVGHEPNTATRSHRDVMRLPALPPAAHLLHGLGQ